MVLFKRKEEPKRSIEDILMPKEIDSDDIVEDCESENEALTEEMTEGDIVGESEKEIKDNALSCFGWEEVKTEKWLIKSAKIWYAIMSFAWFLFGALTFAPIIFISNKIDVIFKDRKKSILFAIIIHTVLIALIVSLFVINRQPVKVTSS